ncbi:MAG: Glutamyl-tRNA(Gln) amidotransferase subunit A [Candidatus Wolfebacteria bacterium GW2011_GWC2_39_22]|uniref:Glutamyl-tRNA(Gln) amidotransferase subunit A n=1 Tax=Candidatus Wolfebacteria bacterium GW2011_GWC2_39_22 TaxID=1619013 RepID=A0A0G0N813_9BACT|nr:MAG: Glutamyl-tRNA(Gln) amidotransferase subunit A [Candidatus Wolfebacteria bacterium GW2011_GWC2_39_22]HBI25930.1 Asp-tRNA(Asn)/Glu-tRNA(Gln) amidotransferase GatCAB subunit A [Candidatus Wolfebacteria bacterium]
MTFLKDLTIKKIHDGLVNKEFTAFELTKEFFDYIETKDKDVQAYLSLDKDGALAAAEAVDIAITKGEEIGMLAGVPMAIKDNLLVKGLPATAASKMLENYTAAYDATVIKKLKEAGAIFLGKANMDEFAMGSSTENSAFKATKNPHDLERVPGGSSGGSAAAVAAHMAVAALGTDTGGSIRQPASLCGVVGLKPTYGAVSRSGAIAMASSLDQIGPLTKTVEDAAIVFSVIKGKDPLDATSVDVVYGDELLNPKLEDIKKLRIGLPKEYFIEGMDDYTKGEINKAIEKIKSLGIEVKEISLPNTKHALSCYYIIMPAEVSSNMARFDGIRYSRLDALQENEPKTLLGIYHEQRGQGFGKEVRRRIMLGTYVLSSGYYDAYYAKAQKVRKLIKEDFDNAFKEVDVILTPVSPTAAFKIGEKTSDPLQMYLSDIFTLTLNLAGLPGISIPVKQYEGTSELPVGFQLVGKAFREADILGIGQFYERIR